MHHRRLPLALLLTLLFLFLTACSSSWFSAEEKVEETPQVVATVDAEDKVSALPKPESTPAVKSVPLAEPPFAPEKKKEEIKHAAPVTPTPVKPQPVPAVKEEPKKEIPPSVATTVPPVVRPTGTLHGTVQIIGKNNKSHRPTNVVITLSPESSGIPQTNAPVTHNINMKKKTYTPVVQTIHKGDSLQFNNKDNIKHNVFSSSGDNTFDLGTFEGGGVRAVQMNHSGIVKVYCNIHPEMATFVMVTDNSFNAITSNSGEFVIENIPPGNYLLSLWHLRGELEQDISIVAGNNSSQELTINASSYKRVAHKNKFGEDYQKKPALFEDEFY